MSGFKSLTAYFTPEGPKDRPILIVSKLHAVSIDLESAPMERERQAPRSGSRVIEAKYEGTRLSTTETRRPKAGYRQAP